MRLLVPLILFSALLIPQGSSPAAGLSFPADAYRWLEDSSAGQCDIRLRFDVGRRWSRADAARIMFCADEQGDGLRLDCTSEGISLGKIEGGVETLLGQSAGWPEPLEGNGYDLAIKRRGWSVAVLLDGATLIRVHDSFAPGEKVGWALRSVRIQDPRVQPVDEMILEDGFARPPDEPNPWEPTAGEWETSLPKARNRKAVAEKSANPFSFGVCAEDVEAMAVNGWDFWDGYRARVAVRPADPGWVGLAFYVQANGDCYVLRAPCGDEGREAPGRSAQLVRKRRGAETVLASLPLTLPLDRWQELDIRAFEGRLESHVNGLPLPVVMDEKLGEGRLALYARNCEWAYFDDVRLGSYARYQDSFDHSPGIPVEALRGQWERADGSLVARVDDPAEGALALSGGPDWENACFAVDVTPESASVVGLRFGCADAEEGYAVRWTLPSGKTPGSLELGRLSQGQWTVLDRAESDGAPRSAARFECSVDRGYVAVRKDGRLVLDAVDPAGAPGGRVGYLVQGKRGARASFASLDVRFLEPAPQPQSVTEQFAKENTMADWARPGASWTRANRGVRQYSLPVWGDFTLRARLADPLASQWSFGLSASAGKEVPEDAGPALALAGDASGARKLLLAGAEDRALELPASGEEISFQRRGRCLLARVGEELVGWARVGDGLSAPYVNLHASRGCADPNEITLVSPNIVDEVFANAPVDWDPVSGNWDISDRWHCSPQWSWFCGRDVETPLLWFRRPVGGDVVFEYWGAMMMDLTEAPHYSHPSDLNSILCGDGAALCSGYGLVFAGDNNKIGRILRKGETVAQSSDFAFVNPVGANSAFHNVWFHSRVERAGDKLTYTVAGHKPLEYQDPAPLEDGYVGVWTHQGNGILIARARIAFQHSGDASGHIRR